MQQRLSGTVKHLLHQELGSISLRYDAKVAASGSEDVKRLIYVETVLVLF